MAERTKNCPKIRAVLKSLHYEYLYRVIRLRLMTGTARDWTMHDVMWRQTCQAARRALALITFPMYLWDILTNSYHYSYSYTNSVWTPCLKVTGMKCVKKVSKSIKPILFLSNVCSFGLGWNPTTKSSALKTHPHFVHKLYD